MQLNRITLSQFKNLDNLIFEPKKGLNFIIGDNGVGKTNLLDAIHYCCMTKSFFQKSDKYCIQKGTDFFRIESIWDDADKLVELNVKCKQASVRQVDFNGQNYKKASDHLGRIPVVMITPNEIYTFIHETEERRRFLNQTLIQMDKGYLDALSQYNKLLIQRVAMLKRKNFSLVEEGIVLDSYEELMCEAAKIIYLKRKELVQSIFPLLNKYSLQISKGSQESTMEYSSDVAVGNLLDIWKREREADRLTGRIHSGIHRDKLECMFNKESLKIYGSQGQIKTFVMALRMAQVHYLMANLNHKPIILLDDVFAKLDEQRVEELINLIEQLGIEQCFITDTHLDRALKLAKNSSWSAHIWQLNNQKIELYA